MEDGGGQLLKLRGTAVEAVWRNAAEAAEAKLVVGLAVAGWPTRVYDGRISWGPGGGAGPASRRGRRTRDEQNRFRGNFRNI